MRWQLELRRNGGVTIIDMSELGEAEEQESQDLRETIKELIGRGEKNLLVNLAGVGYIDSSGIARLA